MKGIDDKFYTQIIHSYWDAERRHVDEEYRNIPFPFEEIKNPGFATRVQWNLEELEGYLNTWSAAQRYLQINKISPVNELMNKIKAKPGIDRKVQLVFPIFMRIGIIKK